MADSSLIGRDLDSSRRELRSQIAELVEQYFLLSPQNEFIPGNSPVPVSGKVIDAEEMKFMVEASMDGWLTSGRFNSRFETELSKFLNIKHLLTVNSGSSANLVALTTLCSPKLGDKALKKGDEVITVAAGFPTTINPIIQNGLIPVFIDVELGSYNIDATKIEAAISERTKAIMLAHTLGNPFDLGVVAALCKKHDLFLIEDACDALGSTYDGKLVGTFGDIGTLSFYPAHHITMGEGGAVFMQSGKLKRIAESIRDWGRDCYCAPGEDNTCNNRYEWTSEQLGGALPNCYDHKYIYSHVGYNLKITDMQAACGLAQLAKLSLFIEDRKQNFRLLRKELTEIEEHIILPVVKEEAEPAWFGFPITIRDPKRHERARLLKYLEEKNIATRLLFGGNITKQPYFSDIKFRMMGELANTDFVMENTFWLGVYPGLKRSQLDFVIASLKTFFEK
jgi:CDP-6-deoxy-D-xylo-4-hexulose-3-dehydrase